MPTRRSILAGTAALLAFGRARAQTSPVDIAVLDAEGVSPEALATATATIDATGSMRARPFAPSDVDRALAGASAALFTGGRGSVQGRLLGDAGRERIRAFVRSGGGYVGICAGAYMALQGDAEFHKIAIVAGRHATGDAWIRGIAPLRVTPTSGAPFAMHYANGPLIAPERVRGLAPFTPLAAFDEEVHREQDGTHAGEMRGMPAILAARYGRGRIVLFSPNPTLEPARPDLLVRALDFVARGGEVPRRVTWQSVFER